MYIDEDKYKSFLIDLVDKLYMDNFKGMIIEKPDHFIDAYSALKLINAASFNHDIHTTHMSCAMIGNDDKVVCRFTMGLTEFIICLLYDWFEYGNDLSISIKSVAICGNEILFEE